MNLSKKSLSKMSASITKSSKGASKILTNPYFLYFVAVLSVANILGYLVSGKLNAVIFFALVGLVVYQFNKNMAVVLLVALIATNLVVSRRGVLEGLTGDSSVDGDNVDGDNVGSGDVADDKIKADKAKLKLDEDAASPTTDDTAAAASTTSGSTESNADESFAGIKNSKLSGAPVKSSGRIDYASTMEQSYDNLDKMLGSDSLAKMSNDTKNLMDKQQQLFNTMQQMVPALESAKSMLGGFDLGKLGELGSMAVNKTN